ncbi:MAG: DUF1559 domain-containing protein [Armatimonadetes bacterium]|jgi:prepilin-type processing-associated H-X9-DG protein|nr:DUF1559 domain-containing protein [Armatimonadota bacterium]
MRINREGASTNSESGPRHHKEIHAPDPLQLPGKLPVPASTSRRDSLALRHAAQALVYCCLAALFLVYVFQIWSRGTETARRKVCRSQLHHLGLALQMYADDYDGMLPPGDGFLPRDLRAYVEDPAWFFCPSDDVSRPFLRRSRGELLTATSYTYRSPQGSVDAQPEVASFALMWDTNGGIATGAHRKGGNVLYLDGHLQWLPSRFWSAADWPWY